MHDCRGGPHCPQAQASQTLGFLSWWDLLLAKGRLSLHMHFLSIAQPPATYIFWVCLCLPILASISASVTFLHSVSEGGHIVTFWPLFQVLTAAEFFVIGSPSRWYLHSCCTSPLGKHELLSTGEGSLPHQSWQATLKCVRVSSLP